MKRFSEQLKKKSDSIRLRTSERAELRDRLVSYMEYHPLPAELRQKKAAPSTTSHGIASEPFTALPVSWFWVRNFSAAFALFVMIVVPVAAEHTTPGDVLYPVKVRFNEEVRSSLTLSPYEKIEWETTRLERRITEARQLASEGKLTDDVEAQVAEAVKEHSEKAKSEIAALRQTDSDEAAIAEISFASALAVQSEVLQKTVEITTIATGDDPVSPNKAGTVLASLVAHESDAADATQAAATPSYEKLLARVEKESTDAYELFESVKDQASDDERTNIDRRLSDIERKVTAAMALVVPEPVEEVMPDVERASTTDDAAPLVTDETTSTSTDEVAASSTVTTASDTPDVTVEIALVEETTEVTAEEDEAARKATAVTLLREALTDLKKLTSFMADLTVRESVSIDTLVPITLTAEERRTEVQRALEHLTVYTESHAGGAYTGPKAEKLNAAMAELLEDYQTAQSAFAAGNLDQAEAHVSAATALMTSIETMAAGETPRATTSPERSSTTEAESATAE